VKTGTVPPVGTLASTSPDWLPPSSTYPVGWSPPAGAIHPRVSKEPTRANTANPVGGSGANTGVATSGWDIAPAPVLFRARSRIRYVTPLLSPPIRIGETADGGVRPVHVAPSSNE
jgi:hypothetical protein